ncbi:MAG: cytochrome c biogenesis protein ResB [Planctomycetota bacterium]
MRLNKKTLRLVLLWISLFLMYRLADYSVSAAFLGAEPAGELFSSFAMFLFWLTFIATLAVTVFLLPYRGLGLLTMHLGCAATLLGGLLGSSAAHQYLYGGRIYKGYMQIGEGGASAEVYSAEGEPIDSLDFELVLEDFSIDRYQEDDESLRWELWSGLRAEEEDGERPTVRLDWREGQEIPVPNTDITLEVLEYEQREIPRPPGIIIIHSEPDDMVVLPAIVGREVQLPNSKKTYTVRQVFRGLRIDPETKQPVDDPSGGFRPAAVMEVAVEGEQTEVAYAFTRELNARMRRPAEQVFVPINKPDMETLAVPTIKFRFRRHGAVREKTVSPAEGLTHDVLSLEFMYEDPRAYAAAGEPILAIQEPTPTIKTYESKVVVKEDDRTVKRASIRVNHPLHHEGYHFYQTDYDHEGHTYTVLSVVSDRGMWLVYTGFVLLLFGTTWHCWFGFVVRKKGKGATPGQEDEHAVAE